MYESILNTNYKWLAGFVAAVFLLITGCQPQAAGESPASAAAPESNEVTTVEGLQITDVAIGDGAKAEPGADIVVHYTGWLFDSSQDDNKGAKFDSSVDRNQPFQFPLGAGRVIKGWDQGFDGMQVGGKRVLVIPPEMGYGSRGAGAAIPPNATLMFEVELLDVR
jgi:FKBP-type peptidyl-prolyl cis-trans isomerase FkpA